ncbi:MAG: MoaD/ThiS family protein [Chloroflexota bacterium]
MKVYVKLFATLIRSLPDTIRARYPDIRSGVPLTVELPEGSTLDDLVAHLDLPRQEVKVMFVNGRAQEADYRLSEDDQVGLFPPVGGG